MSKVARHFGMYLLSVEREREQDKEQKRSGETAEMCGLQAERMKWGITFFLEG